MAALSNENYHDRVASKYDDIYKGARWDLWYDLSWTPMKAYIPSDLRAPVADLGCGTGKYGLKIAKSGYQVTLSDLSRGMLEVTRQKAQAMGVFSRCAFVKADVMDLSELPRDHFALAVAQGDVPLFASNPARAVKEVFKILRPQGVLVASLDATLAAIDHYAERRTSTAWKNSCATAKWNGWPATKPNASPSTLSRPRNSAPSSKASASKSSTSSARRSCR